MNARLLASLPALITVVAVAGGARLALRATAVPYNIREVAADYPTLAPVAVSLALLAGGAIPMWLVGFSDRRARTFASTVIVTLLVIASVVFAGLRLVVPDESLDDIVGFPRLGIGQNLERWLRFVGLFIGPLAGLTIGIALTRVRRLSSLVTVSAVSLAIMALSWIVVVPFAITSNVVELLHGRGDSVAALGIGGYVILIGAVIGLGASTMRSPSTRRVALAAAAMLVAVPVGWLMFVSATNPRLEKYGQVFSARQFLLSPDRDHYVSEGAVMIRFLVAHVALCWMLFAGAASVLALRRDRSRS